MLNRGSYFSGQSRDEKIVLFRKRHWITFAPWFLISLFLLIVVPIAAYRTVVPYYFDTSNLLTLFSQKPGIYWLIAVYSMYNLAVLAVFLNSWLNYYLNTTIITTKHLVDIRQDGLFNHKVSEQNLLQVQDVSSYMKGIFQTFFRYGRVMVETAGDQPNFIIPNVPAPYKIANTIMKLHHNLVETGENNHFQIKDTLNLHQHTEHVHANNLPTEAEPEVEPYQHSTADDDFHNQITRSDTDDQKDYSNDSKISTPTHDEQETIKNQLEGDLEEGKSIRF